MKEYIIRKLYTETDEKKLLSIMEILGIKDTYLKRKSCVHKWKYLSGSEMNELSECTKCGAVG